MRPNDDDVAAAASGSGRHTRLRAAGQAIELICREIGDRAALVLLWDRFEQIAAKSKEDSASRG
jgi:hypothetical protein